MENEIWKALIGFENLYEISNYGNIKSLSRKIDKKLNSQGNFSERILKERINTAGYNEVILTKDKLTYRKSIHRLVFAHFNGDLISGMVIDHDDNNKRNNFNENLKQITYRENNSKDKKKKSSRFTGVSWNKNLSKWQSLIRIDGKLKHLGFYSDETEASEKYQSAIKQIGI